MADNVDVIIENEEDLIKKQKSEAKELQAQVQKLKHSVPKGDKKRKKEVNAEIEKLEAEQKKRHQSELLDFQNKISTLTETKSTEDVLEDVSEKIDDFNLNDEFVIESDAPAAGKKKKSKAKRRREKKQEEEQARQDRIQACEEDSEQSARNIEAANLKAILDKRNLMIHEIPSDGNCLYSAIVDQLQRQGVASSITSLRLQTAAIMRTNSDEFLPFLTHPQTGLPLTDEQYDKYCDELETTPAWGGQVEIRALATILEHPIEVVQADGPCIHTGQEYDKESLILSYHRHIYGLGEHFNSVIPKVVQEEHFTTVT